jgi:hypothetical protein
VTDGWDPDLATAVAYHEVTLAELRGLFDQLDFDLEDLLERELEVKGELADMATALDDARAKLEAGGAVVSVRTPDRPGSDAPSLGLAPPPSHYEVPLVPAVEEFGLIIALAEARLEQLGVDLRRDPLLPVLPSTQIARSLKEYADTYGETDWSEADWAVVVGAGLIGTLLDVVLVAIPEDSTFLGKQYQGSQLTRWLKEGDNAARIRRRFLDPLESMARVPYDAPTTAATGGLVAGMRPATHRAQSFGHDPVLGFLIGIADLMHGTGTYVDKSGEIVQVTTDMEPVGFITAMLRQLRHLLSDVATPAGLPPPLFSLLQVGHIRSPFILGPSGVRVPWTDVARYMYVHGYDLRHYFVSGIVPATVTAIVSGYWLLDGLARRGLDADRTGDRAKLTSMLLLGHAIATSGTLLKTGLVFGMNPAALNWSQLLSMVPVTIAWIAESAARDTRIRRGLDDEWQRLLVDSESRT